MFVLAGHEGSVGMSDSGIQSSEIGADECPRCEFEPPFSQRKNRNWNMQQNGILRMWSESEREREK